MHIFVIVAAIVAVGLVVAGFQRPRVAVFVAAILWMLYAYYEYLVATGVLCDANCNIRVDLVFLFPILGLATLGAYGAYEGMPGLARITSIILGVIGLLALALVAESRGYGTPAYIAITLAALAFGVYRFKSRSRPNLS